MALALIFYFVIRGGLLAASSTVQEVSLFGTMAVAGLVGMFSKQATDKLREVFDNLFATKKGKGDDQREDKLGERAPVKKIMLPVNQITVHTIPEGKSEIDVTIAELRKLLTEVVTRIPVLYHGGAVSCIIHQSLLYKFIVESGTQTATLQDFLGFADMEKQVSESLAFVKITDTIQEAKKAMEETPTCQDVLVTENADRKEPILGWLTNIEISRQVGS